MKDDIKRRLSQELNEEEYKIIVEKGTERPFSGEYNKHYEEGIYNCKACGEKLFHSDSKFDSGSGWPSFDRSAHEDAISENKDSSHGMIRTEIVCNKCGAHLGHVFPDGPTETGQRYCVNSASLNFKSKH
jgi:peptide-methionine (R)-S-oxide reductase